MVTGIVEVTQDPEKAGSALKVLSLRLRGMKGQLEELGEETDENVENISKMQGQILNMTGGKVNIFDASGNFKSTYEIMKGIANVWDDLNSIDQANLLETIAGKNRANDVAALISNWQNVEEAVKSASEAEGSAARENSKYVDSLKGRLDKLTTAWQSFAETFMSSDFLKGAVSGLTTFVELVESLVKTLGTAGTIGLGAGIFGIFKNRSSLSGVLGDFSALGSLMSDIWSSGGKLTSRFKDIGTAASQAGGSILGKLTGSLSGTIGVIGLVVAAIGLGVNAYKNYKESISEARQEVIQASDEFLDASLSFEQAYIKYSGKTDLTAEEEAELESAIKGTVDALGDKSSALQNAVDSSNDYLTSLERIADAELQEANRAAKQKRDNAKLELEDVAFGWSRYNGGKLAVLRDTEAIDVAEELGLDKYKNKGSSNFELQLQGDESVDEVVHFYNLLLDFQERLSDKGLVDTVDYERVTAVIDDLSESVKVYVDSTYEAVKANYQLKNGIPKTVDEYIAMRKAILKSGDVKDLSFDTKLSIVDSLDSDYSQMFDLTDIKIQAKQFEGLIKGYGNGTKDGTNEIGTVETFLNMRTAVNNNECTVGQYMSELNNVTSMTEKFSDEEREEFNLAFGIDTDSIVEQYNALKTKLTDEYYGIEMSNNNAKMFLDNLKSRELSAATELFSSDNVDFKNILKDYNDVLDEAKQAGVDFSKTTYGNIDTNARQVLEWNGKNLKKYKDEIMSWEADDAKWDDVKKGYEDTISTVMGAWDTFEIDGKEVDIAFSPVLQTDGGAELLSSGAAFNYIEELIGKATEDGKWTNDELLKLDAEGLEVDGQKIKGILADIGDTAEATSMQMHFVGKDGALAMAEEELFAIVEAQARLNEAMNFTIAMDVETESIEAFNTAMSESVSAAGLSSDSIAALKGRYAELAEQGYDLSSMFEETANGIHLNREAISEFEQKLASDKLSETEGHLTTLKGRYDELTEEIKNCTDAGERANLYTEQQQVAQKINDLATLASQYEGLTSAYNAWQNAESAGNERDMYENVLSGFETVEDELSRGWADDGTVKFLELITGETDLAGKSAKELKEIWNGLDDTIKNTSYSVKDFFTTDEDGNSTSKGVYNFLNAIQELESSDTKSSVLGKTFKEIEGIEKLVEKKDGKIVGFNFDIVGGDEAIAEALGISEELVQIMLRAADDAGFVVTIDGEWTQLADLKTSAEESESALKKLKTNGLDALKDFNDEDLDFNFDANNLESLNGELEKAMNVLDKFRNKDGTVNMKMEGAEEALEIASYFTATIDKLTEPVYMQLETNQVEENLQEPLTKMQEFERLSKEKHQLKLTGDTDGLKDVEAEMDEIAKYLDNLDEETKIDLEIDGLSQEEIKDKLEKGEIEIPATVDIQLEMSEDIKDMRLLMMNQLGLASDNEVKLKIGYEIDDSLVDKLTDEEKEVVVKYIEKNEEVWNKLSEEDKEVFIELVASGVDLETLTNDETKEVVIDFVTKNEDEFDKLTDEEKQVVVDLVTDDSALESLENHQIEIEAFARIFGVEKVDDLKAKLDGLTDKQIQVLTKVLGQIDVEKLKTTIAGLDDKTVQAIAKALGEGDVEGLKTTISGLDDKTVQAIAQALGYNDVSELNSAIDNLDPKTVQAIAKTLGIKDVDSLRNAINRLSDKDVKAVANVSGKSDVDGLKSSINNLQGKTVTVWAQIKQKASSLWSKLTGGGGVDGTAHVGGTAFANGTIKKSGRAYKQGDWGTKDSGIALGGEEAPELLVRNGRWHLIGEKGAEFFGYRKGDIIFNASQTREIFEKGKTTHGNGRGKALVSGTAFSKGTGGGFWEEETTTTTTTKKKSSGSSSGSSKSSSSSSKKSSSKSSSSSSSKSSSSSSNASEEAEKFEETIDWIETKIARIERVIDQLDTKASSVYRSWSERNTALANQISEVGNEIDIQQKAYDRYMQEANSIGLSETYASKVRNGTIDIETITDESLKEKIDDYQKYFEAALDCKDAIEELRETEAELYAQRVENVATQYEGILGVIEHEKNMIEEYISQSEANAQLISGEYYKALINNENETVSKLQEQKNKMLSELQAGMNSGTITKGSEAWYDLVNSIDEVTLSIQESNTQIKEWNQTIQQLSWETFDLLQDKISAVSEEADFLIELMSSDKLHDDKGRLTDEGSATMGLHGQNYNAYMYQADLVAKEAERLKKELSKDQYDTELEERYREMISLQQEYILNAQNEKEAIRDLVRDGIELELDSLQELIDKKNEELESEKDLYEYQKKVKEQTEEIADIEKMLSSYSNDTSEEAKAKIQELKVSLEEAKTDLEETEYDKYISDQSAMLDNLYLEYETILNTRLDNLDALVSDVIAQINMDATSISTTLSEKADSVGYTLTDSMKTIWDSNTVSTQNVITNYSEKFLSSSTTTNNALSTINTNLQRMITQLNAIAKLNTKYASISSAANSKKANNSNPSTTTTSKPTTTTNTTKSIKVGGKIDATGAPIYDYVGDTSGERQLYRNNPIYTVLEERNGYLKTRWHKLSSGITGWFKKSDVKAYKTGAKGIDESQFAWTQEGNKAEFIVRPSDGAILTPIAKGDSVLNANASSNIWNIANSPAEFIKENLNLGANVPSGTNVNNSCVQNFENITFNMPNVRSYNELLTQMQKDKNFEKLILSMSVDRLAGKSSLAKGKSIR